MSRVRNPILPGCHPDPSVCRVDGDYYLVTSTFEYFPGLPVFHSTDLAHWECIGHVIDRAGQLDYAGIASSGGLYAPTIRHHDGRFWVVCTLVDQTDAGRGGNFLVTATDPAGPWSDPVWLDAAGIDPSLFFDADGRVWLHGTRLAAEPEWPQQTEVWLRELDPGTMALVGPEQVVWTGALRGAVWAEGPHLYRVDGRYCLLAAEGGTEFHHAVCVARADSVTGPYTGNPGNPVLTHRHLGRGVDVVGAGHADLVQAADGSWWAVLLAMRPYGGYHYPLGRETFLVPVTWEDGWPVFAPGDGRIPDVVEVPFAASEPSGPEPTDAVLPDDTRWTSLRAPWDGFATPHGDGWRLRVLPQTLAEPGTPAFLGLRQQHRDLDFQVTLRAPLHTGEEAGIVVRQSERDHVRLVLSPPNPLVEPPNPLVKPPNPLVEPVETRPTGRSGPSTDGEGAVVRAIHRQAGADTVLGETRLALSRGEPLELGLRVRGVDYALTARIPNSPNPAEVVATADGRTLDSVATGGFLGLWLGVYATSAGAASDTVVDVERVEYRPVPSS